MQPVTRTEIMADCSTEPDGMVAPVQWRDSRARLGCTAGNCSKAGSTMAISNSPTTTYYITSEFENDAQGVSVVEERQPVQRRWPRTHKRVQDRRRDGEQDDEQVADDGGRLHAAHSGMIGSSVNEVKELAHTRGDLVSTASAEHGGRAATLRWRHYPG